MNIPKIRVVSQAWLLMLGLCLCSAISGSASAERSQPSAWPLRAVAPYSYDSSRQTDLVALAHTSGTRFFTLAFLTATRGTLCRVAWNDRWPVGHWMRARIEALRAIGGDVSVAFGEQDLARRCPTVARLQDQYLLAVETYHLTHLDFDIEGENLTNGRVNRLRNRAIAGLQKQEARSGGQLAISYTLPVGLGGLTPMEMSLLRDAIGCGVDLSTVNIMTMNYYTHAASGQNMARNAIDTANNVVHQLHLLYPTRTPAQLWAMLGITPMIGVNNDRQEVFTLQDVHTLLAFAARRHLTWLAFWSVQRDERCTRGQVAPHHCSGVFQRPYQYTHTFAAFGL